MNKRQRKGLFFLIIFAVLLAGGSYYFLGREKTSQNPLPRAALVSPPTESENWQEKNLGFFSFKYPPYWVERKAVTGGVLMLGPASEETVWLGVGKTLDINSGQTPTKLASQALGLNEEVLMKKETYIDGHPVVVQKRRSEAGVRLEAYIGEVKYLASLNGEKKSVAGTQLIFMEARSAASAQTAEKTFDEILATFKYLE